MQNTSFLETQTVLEALEFAISNGGFGANTAHKKTAAAIVKRMKSNKSIAGRHLQLAAILKKGASIEQMMKAVGTSRRSIFRYLNHFEEAGHSVAITKGKYKLKS